MAAKLRKDDEVVVIAGRDRGKRGRILSVQKDGRALVAGINVVKKHRKPVPAANAPGEIASQEAPIHLSNLAIFNSANGKADRIGFRRTEDGKKVRFFKSTNTNL